jgi:hypothetical protein
MTDDDEKPLTLPREDLYELVWSKPMRDLAEDFAYPLPHLRWPPCR